MLTKILEFNIFQNCRVQHHLLSIFCVWSRNIPQRYRNVNDRFNIPKCFVIRFDINVKNSRACRWRVRGCAGARIIASWAFLSLIFLGMEVRNLPSSAAKCSGMDFASSFPYWFVLILDFQNLIIYRKSRDFPFSTRK